MAMTRCILAAAFAAAVLAAPPAPASADTLVIAAAGVPEGFDGDALRPHTQHVVVQVYEPLTRYGRVVRDGREYLDPSVVEGHLAESWTVSDDGLRYVLKLREGVLSPYGNELTADDVVWSWNKSFDQKRTGNFIARVSGVRSVEEVSRYEVAFDLEAPSSIFLKALTLYVPGIYDTDEVRRHATADDPWALKWLEANTAGFGAYHLESLRPGEQAVFVANPNYFREQPFFDRVVYRGVPSGASRVTLLKGGQVQWIDRPTFQQVVDLRADPSVKVESSTGRLFAALWMNPDLDPFRDVRVRRAVVHALDTQALRDAVFFGLAEPAETIVPPMVEGSDPGGAPPGHDPAEARRLLEEAGVAGQLGFQIVHSDLYTWLEPAAVQAASQLSRLGIRAEPRRITGSDMRASVAPTGRDLPMFAWEDGPIVLDPVYTLFLIAHSEGVANRNGYSNPEVDRAIDAARVEQDPERRLQHVREAQRLLLADAPYVLIGYPELFEAMAPGISGWVAHPDDHERWYDLRAGG